MKGFTSRLKRGFKQSMANIAAAGLFASLILVAAFASAGPGGPPEGVIPMFQGTMSADAEIRPIFMISLPNQVGQNLETVTLDIAPGTGNPVFQDASGNSELLRTLGGEFGGISIWTSNSPSFDTYYSEWLPTDGVPQYSNNTVTFDLKGAGFPIREGGFFFVTLMPNDKNVKHNKSFTLTVPSDGIVTSGDDPAYSVATSSFTIDGTPAVRSLVPKDMNSNGTHLEQGDQLKFVFNQQMDVAAVTAGNVDVMLPAENPANNFAVLTYGSNPTVQATDTFAQGDTIIVTLGANPTIVEGAEIWPNIGAMNNPTGFFQQPVVVDITGPKLQNVILFKDAGPQGPDGAATNPGDSLMFVYDEPVSAIPLDPAQIDSVFPASSGTFGATNPPRIWNPDNNVIGVMLSAPQTDTVGATVNPSNAITDKNGNKDATEGNGPAITVMTVSGASWVDFRDGDAENPGIDNNDIVIDWGAQPMEGTHFDLYLLPDDVPLNTQVHNRINSSNVPFDSMHFEGTLSTYFLDQDSRFDFQAVNPVAFYPLQQDQPYKVCVVAVDDGSQEESMPVCSSPNIMRADSQSGFTNDQEPPYVMGLSPFNGQVISSNLSQITVEMSEGLLVESVIDANVLLEADTNNDGTFETNIAKTLVVRGDWVNEIWVSLTEPLMEGAQLRLKIANVTDVAGNSLGNYEAYYTVSASDSTSPKVLLSSVQNGAVGVSPLTSQIGFNMSEPMLADTINPNNVTIVPNVSGVSVGYDVGAQAVVVSFGTVTLASDTEYTVTLKSTCQDVANNALDGDGNGTGGDDYQMSFTTGAVDVTVPDMMWLDMTESEIRAGFNTPMKQSSITDPTTWTVTKTSDGSRVPLAGATFTYNDVDNTLIIAGVQLALDTEYKVQAVATLKGLNGVNIGTNNLTGVVHSNWDMFDATKADGEFLFGGGDIYSADMKTFSPVMVMPFDRRANVESNYGVSFPTTKSIPAGGKIVLTFPGSFLVANAQMVAVAEAWMNQDINGPGQNTITISNVAVDTINKTVTLTTAGGATGDNDYMDFVIKGVTNGPASAVDWFNNTGGYTVSVKTKDNNGAPLESSVVSERFEVFAAGGNTITVNVKDASHNAVAENDAKVYLWGPTGELSGNTDASGVVQFTSLSDGTYWATVESLNENYANNFNSTEINVNAQNDSVSRDISLGSRSETMNFTINHNGIGGDGTTQVELYASSYNGWYEKTITLDNDGSTSASMKVGTGEFFVGVRPALKSAGMMVELGNSKSLDLKFFQPPEQKLRMDGAPVSATFNLSVPNRTINVTVTDQSGNVLNGVDVWAYNPEGGMGGGGGVTDASGQVAMKVVDGVFKVGAFKDGMPPAPEQRVEVSADNANVEVTIKMMKATASISGTVVDDNGNPVQGVSVNCWSNQGYGSGDNTDSSGAYSMFVRGGVNGETYTCEAYSNVYGRMNASTGVDVTDFTVASAAAVPGKNFEYASAGYNSVAGSVGLANVSVWAVEETANGDFVNWGGGTTSEDTGDYLLRLPKNAVGNHYQLMAWSPETGGDITGPQVDISSSSANGKNITLGDRRVVTASVSNVPSGITEVFVDAFNKTTYTGNGTSLSVSNGTAAGTFKLADGTYEAHIWVPGFGEIRPDAPDTDEFTVSADKTLNFDLSSLAGENMMTVSGTVKNSGGQGLARAWVDMFNPQTGQARGMETESDGTWSLTVKSGIGAWFVTADKEGYVMSGAPQEINAASSGVNFTLTTADQTITGLVSDANGPVTDGWVWAQNGNGGHAGSEITADGTYTLNVTAGTWQVCASTPRYEDCQEGVAAGSTTNITLSSQHPYYDESKKPVNSPIVPTQGGTVDANGFQMAVPANALGDGSSGTLSVSPTAAPKSSTKKAVGGAYEITATSGGSAVNSLQNNVDITLEYTKSTMDSLVDSGDIKMNARTNDAEKLTAAYLNGNEWVPLATTKKIQVKEGAGDSFTPVDYTTAMNALEADNDAYYDYKILVEASTDHFTVFGTITGSDETAPAAPSGLGATATSGQVVLDWDDNAEGDFMEYLLFRSTSSGFTPGDGNQLNSSQLTSSTYTDTTVVNGTTYYYVVKAVDTSGNESSATTEVSAAPAVSGQPAHTTAPEPVISSGPSSSNDDEDEVDDDAADTETTADAEATADDAAAEASTSENADSSESNYVSAGYDVSSDVEADYEGHWAQEYIEEVLEQGWATGYSSTEFRPDNNLNRAEFIKMIVNAAGYEIDEDLEKAPFKDINVHVWYAPYVAAAKEHGLIAGYADGTFKATQEINRAEAMKIVCEALLDMPTLGDDPNDMLFELGLWSNPFRDIELTDWYTPYVLYAYSEGVVSGYKAILFAPERNLTRAEFAKILTLSMD